MRIDMHIDMHGDMHGHVSVDTYRTQCQKKKRWSDLKKLILGAAKNASGDDNDF